MSELIFSLAAGRSGSAWLAKFLEANLGFPTVHEPFGIDDFGNTMPDIRTMRSFNMRGMDDVVRGFWGRKMASLPKDKPYAETNHTLGKCGLIETLIDHPRCDDTTVIILRRNLAKQCASYIQRNDCGNMTLLWQWYLAPNYRNVILKPESFLKMGVVGTALWYTLEMECRQHYYEQVYGDRVRFVHAQLEDVITPEGARKLLADLGRDQAATLPPKANANVAPPDVGLIDEIDTFLSKTGFDAQALVAQYLEAGFSLDQSHKKQPQVAASS
ncbi:MAG: hypothetical protein P1U91_16215 [Pseudophaeobacter sp. bin_em_oilr2.035]|nr:hypothetical protein [Phaeobacter gallaeciensis]MDF1773499.1 hypothetical protein [Pseudophaeobacter sp. bin_em_oilr2.035]MDE4143532.1 hypothetical protein [Phaeobacter gallaeciensis]MDE4160293.1 hypothetical protein [Phaeobacter gallaeciensis]MDE4168747.1 hypothetical protein [Phaeobacter gallaeciensis]MDE4177272.1 hypothetical protein [Phaeobacter gallaeciensis]